jgi:hypothetical protein
MKKVMIGTPCYDGSLELTHVQSLFETVDLCRNLGITITMEYVVGNSLVQTARNELFRRAIEDDVDDLIFIDGDQGWNGQDFINLISHQKDVIGGVVVGKKDHIMYNAKPLLGGFKLDKDGLIEVMRVGTGFMRISKRALHKMWEMSEPYKYETKDTRSVFEAKVIDGNMYGEDIAFCQRWRALGEKVYIDPTIVCSHVGKKEWRGNFVDYLRILGVYRDKSA